MTAAYGEELAAALEAVAFATRLCVAVQADLGRAATKTKADRSPVTAADYGSQAVITLLLARTFGNDPVVGEEDAGDLRRQPDVLKRVGELVGGTVGPLSTAELLEAIDRPGADPRKSARFWTLDPIDGTKGFLRGEQFAVALALVEGGEVVLGVLGCPNYPIGPQAPPGGTFFAVRDAGAWVRPASAGKISRLAVGMGKDPAALRFCESVESAHAAHETHRRIADLLGITAAPFRMDSQAKYAAIARGDADIYLRLPRDAAYREKIWDHAAGSILVREAGGCVTDFDGKPLDFSAGKQLGNRPGLLACNRRIHEAALTAVLQAQRRGQPPYNASG
jgi:3'(2'), 5'-bisphosphate nucleotidase